MSELEEVADITEGVISIGKKKLFSSAGIIGGVAGFVSDVLQPIAPIALYLFIASAVLLILSFVYYLKAKRGSITSIILLMMTLVLGCVSAFQHLLGASEEGVMSKAVPGIAEFQKSLGIIQGSLDEIKEDTKQTLENTDKANEKLIEINQKIDALDSLGATELQKNPSTAEGFYHNAKIYELKGDYGNARRAYKSYIDFNTDKLEPHLRLTDFLRVNEGRAGALEEYRLLTQGNNNLNVEYTILLLAPLSSRKAGLIIFQAKHPDYAPVYYHLSNVFSVATLGQQSLADKLNEYKWMKKFLQFNESGELTKYFVDKQRLLDWQNDIASRMKIAEVNLEQLNNPVSILNWTPSNQPDLTANPSVIIGGSIATTNSLTGTLNIIEPAIDIEVRTKNFIAEQEEFKSLGHESEIDPVTRKPIARHQIILSNDQHFPQDFEVRYQNTAGQWSDTYTVSLEEFHVKATSVDDSGKVTLNPNTMKLINENPQNWCWFRSFDSRLLLYFTSIVKCRGVIEEISYSLDSDTLDQDFALHPYEGISSAPLSDQEGNDIQEILKEVPNDTKFVSIQLTFKDGTKSDIVKIVNSSEL
ncbi:hypothetical protein OAB00_02380 [Akkermansiaceae bacterium]|nr:hypothetical protein [Akkermansiaceae bacterium]